MRFKQCCLVLFVGLSFAAGATWCLAGADEEDMKKKEVPPVPPAEDIDSAALHRAARVAIACGAEYLLSRAETNYLAMVVEPCRRRSVRKAYTRRFRKETYDHKVYDRKTTWQYEEVLVRQRASAGDVGKLVKVKRRIPGTGKTTSKYLRTEKRTRLVPDKDGEVIREYPAENIPEVWQRVFQGQNALALYAVLKAGVSRTEPRVTQLAENLYQFLDTFGLPDVTWETAWAAAAFIHLEGKNYERMRDSLIRKLLEGQITEGPARGMWGVICINPELLSAMMAYDQGLAKEVERRRKNHQAKPDSMAALRRFEEIQTAHEKFSGYYKEVSQQGLRFREVTKGWTVPVDLSPEPLVISGLPYYFYSQSVADMENTALVLYVLRIAADRGCLPEEVLRPELPDGRRLLPAQKTSAILARAASAIAKAQARNGTWNEVNIHQPVSYFQPIGVEHLEKEEIKELTSPHTLLSTVQACTALLDAGRAVGVTKLLGKFGAHVIAGQGAQRKAVEVFLDATQDKVPVGRRLAPYDLILKAQGVERSVRGGIEERRDLWNRLAYCVAMKQNLDGSWGDKHVLWQSSGLYQFEDQTVCRRQWEARMAKIAKEKRRPYDSERQWSYRYRYHSGRKHPDFMDSRAVATAYSMLFLEDGLRGPLAAFVPARGKTDPPRLLTAVRFYLQKRDRIVAPAMILGTQTADVLGSDLPIVFVDGAEALADAPVTSALRAYTGKGGVVIVQVPDKGSVAAAEARLAGLIPGAKAQAVPSDAAFLARYKGKPPQIRGIMRSDNDVAALVLTPNQIQEAYLMARHRAGPRFLDREYPLAEEIENKFVERLAAVQALDRVEQVLSREPSAAVKDPEKPPVKKASGPGPDQPEPKKEDSGEPRMPEPPKVTPKKTQADETW